MEELEKVTDAQLKEDGYVSLEDHLIKTVEASSACQALKTSLVLAIRGAASTKDNEAIELAMKKHGVTKVTELIAKI